MIRYLRAALVFALAGHSTVAGSSDVESSTYEDEIDQWHHERTERLRRPTGWLSLVGLFPLADGESRFGSDPKSDFVAPESAPAHIGTFLVAGGRAQLRTGPGVQLLHGEEVFSSGSLQTDVDGEPTVLSVGSLSFYVIDRDGTLYVRAKDSESPVLAQFKGIERFEVNPDWRIEARYEPYDPPRPLAVPTVLGTTSDAKCHGAVVFEIAGETVRLEPTGKRTDSLFLVFGDATNGEETYGAGRFLYIDPPSEDNRIVIDFNRSYNPPCVFTPYATCPLPPPGNRLGVRIEAGERNYDEYP